MEISRIPSLEDRLYKLNINEASFKNFQEIMGFLQNIRILIESIQGRQMCGVVDLLKLLNGVKIKDELQAKSGTITSADVYKIVKDCGIAKELPKVLNIAMHFVMYIMNTTVPCDYIIIYDNFVALKNCVFVFNTCNLFETEEFQNLIKVLLKRFIDYFGTINTETYRNKVGLYNLVGKLLIEFGEITKYGFYIIERICERIDIVIKYIRENQNVVFQGKESETLTHYLVILQNLIPNMDSENNSHVKLLEQVKILLAKFLEYALLPLNVKFTLNSILSTI